MKIVQINVTAENGGTGKICDGISRLLNEKNIENYVLYVSNEKETPNRIKYSNNRYIKLQALFSRVFGNYGFNCVIATKRLIKKLDEIKPDVVHLHNLHGHNVNLKMLFEYFKKNPQIRLFWTFHDCWSFTGYCPYFEISNCEKWKSECGNCPQKRSFSWFFDKSKKLQRKKKELIEGLDITIVAPSYWLSSVIEESFFKNQEIKVIQNATDLSIFKPTESDFRKSFGLEDKYIVLGVAANWERRKGIDVFFELSRLLPEKYKIVLVGADKKLERQLPENIISVGKINDKTELAKIYTASDVFVNPTREEVFGLVNIEALACGTPVVTFNAGGSPECVDESCGFVVEKNDICAMKDSIERICEEQIFTRDDCLKRAKKFDENIKYEEFLQLYLER